MLEAAVGPESNGDQPVSARDESRAPRRSRTRWPSGRGAAVREYLVALAHATRAHRQVTLGLSPRGLLIWQRLAQASAFLAGRTTSRRMTCRTSPNPFWRSGSASSPMSRGVFMPRSRPPCRFPSTPRLAPRERPRKTPRR